jgi:PKD domain
MSNKQVFSTFFIFMILLIGVFPGYAVSWQAPKVIAGDSNHEYQKPEAVFGPSGAVYIVYRDKNKNTHNSDIMLSIWDGRELVKENVSNLGQVWNKFDAEESDIYVDQDETIHVVWMGADQNNIVTRHIMYRYKQGDTWSQIYYLGDFQLPDPLQYMIGTHIAVDSMGNVHVVTCIDRHDDDSHEERSSAFGGINKTSYYVGKFGDTITSKYQFPGNNAKEPDIAVDDNFVYITWMHKNGFSYYIAVQKWENKPDANKGSFINVTTPLEPYSSQKSRIDVDREGKMHVIEFIKKDLVKKMRYFKEQSEGSFSSGKVVSVNQNLLYHKQDLRVRDNSILVTMQKGQSAGSDKGGAGVYFNWQRNDKWGGCLFIPGSEYAVYPSNDLSEDGEIAVIAWSKKESHIMLTSSAPITATGTLETQFTQPDTIFWGSEITFDASQCAAMNPEHTIVQYTWDFGDGTIETTSSPTISHTYNFYNSTVPVILTLTAENGALGEFSKDVHIDALYGGTITEINRKRIRTLFYNRLANEILWDDNPLNESNAYPAISKYEIWRAPQSSVITDNSYTLLGEVTAGQNQFLDYAGLEEGVNYLYAIRSVDVEGHISPFNNVSSSTAQKNPKVILNSKLK